MSKHLLKTNQTKKYKQLLLLTTIITTLIWLTIINKTTFFIYCSLSVIAGIITGQLLLQVWLKIQGKKDQAEWWNQPYKSFKLLSAKYIYLGGSLRYAVFKDHYLQTLLTKREQFAKPPEVKLNNQESLDEQLRQSLIVNRDKERIANENKCSIKQIYSFEELVSLFNLSSKEQSSLALGGKSLENILQSKINHHD